MPSIDIVSINHEKSRVALFSVAAGVGLTLFKTVVALLTGSLALLAETAHSALDLLSALTTLAAVGVSARPADRTHNFGHGKFENLSALVEMLLLGVTVVWILLEAVQRLFFRAVQVDVSIWAFVVMAVSMVVDLSRSRSLGRAAQKYNSQALEADALNYRNDLLGSAVTIAGLLFVRLGQSVPALHVLQYADSIAALGLVVIMTVVSSRLGRQALDVLLDRAPNIPVEMIVQAVKTLPGIIDCHGVRVRQSGPDIFVDVHVTMDPTMPLLDVHQLMGRVESAVRDVVPRADVDVHPEPAGETHGQEGATARADRAR